MQATIDAKTTATTEIAIAVVLRVRGVMLYMTLKLDIEKTACPSIAICGLLELLSDDSIVMKS